MTVTMTMNMWNESLGLFEPGDESYSFATTTDALRFVGETMHGERVHQHTRLDLAVTAAGEIELSIIVRSNEFRSGEMVDRVFFIHENA